MKKLLTINVEGDKHIARITPFIAEENPDIVCMQEVFREDIISLLGTEYQVEFLPLCLYERRDGSLAQRGTAIATRTPAWRVIRDYYFQPTTTYVPVDNSTALTKRKSYWQGVVGITIEDEGADLAVFTTHFTWSPDGMPNEYQTQDLKRFLVFMNEQTPHVLCGDFNLPRVQNALYPTLTANYTDHVPLTYTTSMFLPLHRLKDDPVEGPRISQYMVDYVLSSTGAYRVVDVEMRGNVSDHYAIVATIARAE